VDLGYVYETDPRGANRPFRRDAMGRFTHEAAACDPVRQVIYLTEDEGDGCFYRFRPHAWGDLGAGGTLEVMVAPSSAEGTAGWMPVPVPAPAGGDPPTRHQVPGAKRFDGGEGCYYARGVCYFTTKGDNRVWRFDATDDTYELVYDDRFIERPPLTGVDNVTGTGAGDLYVAEDGGNMEICLITPDGSVSAFLLVRGQGDSEITGPAFSPAGDRLYFSSQRGTSGSSSGGNTYEVRGPFRGTDRVASVTPAGHG
jgi:secreted PhoX family phosphatase